MLHVVDESQDVYTVNHDESPRRITAHGFPD
jgi:hypothetical protein